MKPILAPVVAVAQDVVERAVDATPGLFQSGNGNWCASVRGDLSERIVRELSAKGFLPADDKLEEAEVFDNLAFIVGRMPAALLLDMKRAFTTRDNFLEGPRAEISRRIIRGLEEQGYRLTKARPAGKPSDGRFAETAR